MMSEDANKLAREMSTVQFPYVDLEDSIAIARAMHSAGGVPLERDQLAAIVGVAPTGGNFAIKLSSAKMFGLISSGQKYQLTGLGFEILDADRQKNAKVKAFLNVELYKKVYEEFKGRQLPPRPTGLEQCFVNFGVSQKQKDKARHVFDRSARTAGFFPTAAEDRLVQPVIADFVAAQPEASESDATPERADARAAAHQPQRPALNPFIEGLLSELPVAKSEWSVEDRAKWLQAAAQIFDLIYTGGRGRITVMADG